MGSRVATKKKVGRKAAARKSSRLSIRGFARQLGVTHRAVQKGIESGRLRDCLGQDAQGVFIADPERGRKEWEAGAAKPSGKAGSTRLVDAQRDVAEQRARLLKLEADVRTGKLIDAGKAKREAFHAARTVRDNVLNIPDRVAAELAGETDAARVHARLQDELEKALETIANILSKEAGA